MKKETELETVIKVKEEIAKEVDMPFLTEEFVDEHLDIICERYLQARLKLSIPSEQEIDKKYPIQEHLNDTHPQNVYQEMRKQGVRWIISLLTKGKGQCHRKQPENL